MKPKYPNINVSLSVTDGNAFAVLGIVAKALRGGGVEPDQVKAFTAEATSGDYDNVLATAFRWVDVS